MSRPEIDAIADHHLNLKTEGSNRLQSDVDQRSRALSHSLDIPTRLTKTRETDLGEIRARCIIDEIERLDDISYELSLVLQGLRISRCDLLDQ